jgi:hypothetical protein
MHHFTLNSAKRLESYKKLCNSNKVYRFCQRSSAMPGPTPEKLLKQVTKYQADELRREFPEQRVFSPDLSEQGAEQKDSLIAGYLQSVQFNSHPLKDHPGMGGIDNSNSPNPWNNPNVTVKPQGKETPESAPALTPTPALKQENSLTNSLAVTPTLKMGGR